MIIIFIVICTAYLQDFCSSLFKFYLTFIEFLVKHLKQITLESSLIEWKLFRLNEVIENLKDQLALANSNILLQETVYQLKNSVKTLRQLKSS